MEDGVIVECGASGNCPAVESEQETERVVAIVELNVVIDVEFSHSIRVQIFD
jgi:hypothetical protein